MSTSTPRAGTGGLERDFPLGSIVRIVDEPSRWYGKAARVIGYFHEEAAQGALAPHGLIVTFDRGKTLYNYAESYVRDQSRLSLVRQGSGRR